MISIGIASCGCLFRCFDQIKICRNTKRRKRSLSKDDIYPVIIEQYVYIEEYYRIGEIIYGNPGWLVCYCLNTL